MLPDKNKPFCKFSTLFVAVCKMYGHSRGKKRLTQTLQI